MLKFHRYYSDNAIIQCGEEICVKGYSDSDVLVKITGKNCNYEKKVKAIDGKFRAIFQGIDDTSSVYQLSADNGKEKISINVRFGNVYLTLGQSNMSYTLAAAEDYDKWKNKLKDLDIGLLNLVEKPFNVLDDIHRPYEPQEDLMDEYKWIDGKDSTLRDASAISAQMAGFLNEKLSIPIGVVETAMGGLSIDTYTPRSEILKDDILVSMLKEEDRFVTKERWNNVGIRNYSQTAGVWNEKLSPLVDFKFKGIIWYLGESSVWHWDFACCYRRCLKHLIDVCKETFGDIPFVNIDIAPLYYSYGDSYGYLYINEVLEDAQDDSKKVYTIPIYDIEPRWLKVDGDEYFHPIHTTNKEPVSKRVAEVLSGGRTLYPKITTVKAEGSKLILKVSDVGDGLIKGEVNGFTVAGKDGKYYPADGLVVSEDEIEVSSIDVKEPIKCTYAFTQYQDFCNVKTVDGAPLMSYREEREEVNQNYCFTPAFVTRGAKEVYENNFGPNVGFCRKVNVWTSGKIYRAKPVEISVTDEGVEITAEPTLKDYKYFGVSPEINLCGHKRCLDKFNYLTFSVKANKPCRFEGVVIKLADGNIYRYNLLIGSKKYNEFVLKNEKTFFAADLVNVIRGDSAEVSLTDEMRRSVVELEFYFRHDSCVKVEISDLKLTDINSTEEVKDEITIKQETRTDTVLPEN